MADDLNPWADAVSVSSSRPSPVVLPRVPTPAEQDSAATALLTSTSPPKLTIENDAALLNGADAWADAPSFSRGPSSARASSTSPGPGPNERNEEDDLDPAQIAARDRLDLTPSPSRGEHHHDDDDEDMDDDDDHEPPRHASLGLSSLPTRDEENGFRDFDIPDPQFLTDAELSLRGYTWITAKNGDIPDKAVQGGYVQKKGFFGGASKEPLFVARVKHGPAVVPGKAGKFLGGCNYSLGDGVERMSTTYQILTQPDQPVHTWLPLPPGPPTGLRNLVGAALRTPSGDSVAVARAEHSDGVHIGQLVIMDEGKETVPSKGVFFAWGGKEVTSMEGEVLAMRS